MSDYVSYFAAFIFVLFGIAFFSAMQGFKRLDKDSKSVTSKTPRILCHGPSAGLKQTYINSPCLD